MEHDRVWKYFCAVAKLEDIIKMKEAQLEIDHTLEIRMELSRVEADLI